MSSYSSSKGFRDALQEIPYNNKIIHRETIFFWKHLYRQLDLIHFFYHLVIAAVALHRYNNS